MSKEESKAIQGIAILMMCYLHLFGFPERISFPYQSFFPLSFQSQLACTFKICVCIFSFVSGYGLCKQFMQEKTREGKAIFVLLCNYKIMAKRALSFMAHYWIVFLLFIPGRFILNHQTFFPKEFVENFLGLSWTYNGEWWYVAQYLKLLFLFPVIMLLLDFFKKRRFFLIFLNVLGGVILLAFLKLAFNIGILKLFKVSGIAYLLALIEGAIVAEFQIFEKLRCLSYKRLQIGINVVILVVVLIIRLNLSKSTLIASRTDFIFVPFLCYSLSYLYDVSKSMNMKKAITLLGKNAISIWLTHTFFAYYYFQKIVFLPYFSFLILAWLIFLSLASAYAIHFVSKGILKALVPLRRPI